MTPLHPELQALETNARYARFLRVDLHIHTPAAAWCWNQKLGPGQPKAGTLKPKDVAAAILKSGVDVAAITDHDCVSWVADVMRETRDLAKKQGRRVTVLPGVEVTTYDGVHLLAIFPVDKRMDEIAQMLIRFGLRGDGTQTERASQDWPVAKVAQAIRDESGLVIAPHATNPKMGIWGGSNSDHRGKRLDWMREGVARILACAPAQRQGLEAALRSAGIARRFAYIRHSDAHTFDEIGLNATYIKLAEPTVEGLRQVIHEPDLRVCMEAPARVTHPAILGVEIRGGYFDNETISLSDHLNVLVGPNYSGKSSVVDAIRFVFDDQCFGDSTERQHLLDRIRGIVGDGQVRVWFRDATGSTYRAERSTVIEETRRGAQRYLEPAVLPTVSRIDGEIDVSIDKVPSEVLRIDFYGQGSVGKVAEFESHHREMIDAMGDLSQAAAVLDPNSDDVGDLIQRLRGNAKGMQKSLEDRQALEGELAQVSGLTDQKKKLEAQSRSPLLTGWADWQAYNRAVESIREELDELAERIDTDALASELVDDLSEFPAPAKGLDASAEAARRARDDFEKQLRTALTTLGKTVSTQSTALKRTLDKWTVAFEKQEELVRAKLKELNLANEAALAKRISDLSGRIEKIEKKRPQLERLDKQWTTLQAERARLSAQLATAWKVLREKRQRFVEGLNASTGDNIRIDYSPAADKSRLWKQLDALISAHSTKASIVQRRDTQIDLLTRSYSGEDIAADLLASDVAKVVERSSVTHHTASFLTELPLADRLDLVLCVADDVVTITYRREGDEVHSPLGDLSPGERALALLTVAFANESSPIVIDQPEDELGQALVTADLIETIRAKKQQRQFVVVTHNANVPVLGDAEGIFVLQNRVDGNPARRRCTVAAAGSIECEPIKTALLGLEGGKDSFEKRQVRYNINPGIG